MGFTARRIRIHGIHGRSDSDSRDSRSVGFGLKPLHDPIRPLYDRYITVTLHKTSRYRKIFISTPSRGLWGMADFEKLVENASHAAPRLTANFLACSPVTLDRYSDRYSTRYSSFLTDFIPNLADSRASGFGFTGFTAARIRIHRIHACPDSDSLDSQLPGFGF